MNQVRLVIKENLVCLVHLVCLDQVVSVVILVFQDLLVPLVSVDLLESKEKKVKPDVQDYLVNVVLLETSVPLVHLA